MPTRRPESVKANGRAAREVKGVTVLRSDSEATVFEVGSGAYRFTADDCVIVESAG